MQSKEIKKEFTLKDLSEFYGLTPTTFSNYLRDLSELEKNGFIPPLGRHNIVQALAFYYKFNSVGEEGNSLLFDLAQTAEEINKSMFDLERKGAFEKEYFEGLKRSLKKSADFLVENLS